jgi:hypothetical protein
MSTYFSKVIKAGERQREFNFRQLSAGAEQRYYVDVPDDKGERIIFHMCPDGEGRWKPTTSVLPNWIHTAEDQLSEVITEQLKAEAVRKR